MYSLSHFPYFIHLSVCACFAPNRMRASTSTTYTVSLPHAQPRFSVWTYCTGSAHTQNHLNPSRSVILSRHTPLTYFHRPGRNSSVVLYQTRAHFAALSKIAPLLGELPFSFKRRLTLIQSSSHFELCTLGTVTLPIK
jgi:hypothetical protein